MSSLKTHLTNAIHQLAEAGCDTPRLDAEVLLAHLLQKDRSWLYAHNTDPLPEWSISQFEQIIQRRVQREPVAYITGQREFFGLTFAVTPAVLIPRPETELLVETALNLVTPNCTIADIGTGSGCIAVTLAVHAPTVHLSAVDLSAMALAVAQDNAQRHQVADRIRFYQGDLLAPLTTPVDLLVSNPPYIAPTELATLSYEVNRYEPQLALAADDAGLALIAQILAGASTAVKPGGWLLMEFGASQGESVLRVAQQYAPQASFTIKPDLAGRDRLLVGQF